jgi:opacity protein-like surface antigen
MSRVRNVAVIGTVLGALASGSTMAADRGYYIGLDAGLSKYDISQDELNEVTYNAFDLAGISTINLGSDFDDSGTGYNLVAGYQVLKYLAVEGSYVDLGKAPYNISGTVTSGLNAIPMDIDIDIKSKGAALAVIGILPLNEAWSLDARVGAYFGQFTGDITVSGGTVRESESVSNSATSALYGVGVDYAFAPNWSVRLDYRRFDNVGDSDVSVDLLSAGLRYAF